MKTITQYREEIAALMKAINDIDEKCIADNRQPTDDELEYQNEAMNEVDRIRGVVATMERKEKLSADLKTPAKALTLPGKSIESERNQDRFRTLGEQLCAVIKAGSPGGRTDPRLIQGAASGLNETVSSDGGFLVQQDFTDRLMEDLFTNSLIVSQCERIPISANSNSIKVNGFDETSRASNLYGGVKIYHADEADEKTSSKPKFRKVELSLHKLVGLCYLTDELMMDSPALQGRVSNAFRSAFDFQVQDDIINGTGAGMALGILNAGCLVSVSAEAGQAASTVVTENIVKMYSRRIASQTQNYSWYYNQAIEPQLFTMSVSVGTGGGPVFMPPGGLSGAPYSTILGRPAYAIEQCAALGTVGDIIFGNFRDGYICAEKGGIQSATSIHVRFVYDETALRFTLRFDGQPWRASALTPYKGGSGATQSHFIALASR